MKRTIEPTKRATPAATSVANSRRILSLGSDPLELYIK